MMRQRLVTVGCIVFLAWFVMKFHMDTANDSETQAYVGGLLSTAATHGVASDATGHYAAVVAYFMWPIATGLQYITGAYLIRGLVVGLFVLVLGLHSAAYAWYRTAGLSWLASLVGLVLLSTSVAFATQLHGWELDKLIEPVVFLLAGLAAWHRRWIVFLILATVAAANRETGVFIAVIPLAFMGLRWPFWATLAICAGEVIAFRAITPAPLVPVWGGLHLYETIDVIGGLALAPILALAWADAAPRALKRLLWLMAPVWFVFVVATDRLVQGAVVLAPLALLFVPVTLLGVERDLRRVAPVPAVRAER